ncbi:MAG: (d)CMP kinase [Pseudomonadota bacterium]
MSDEAKAPVIAIDGPSGSGKGTVSRAVAQALGWHLLDSGALYRLVALASLNRGVSLDDEAAVSALVPDLDIHFDSDADGGELVWLDGREVAREIRAETTGEAASRVASMPAVRAALVGLQRGMRQAPGLVADGRDMGTVIFTDAPLKVFLTASAEERANRRYKQLKEKGIDVSLAALFGEITRRDERDSARKVAPLTRASDAYELDTTGVSIADAVARVLSLAEEKGLCEPPA